MTQTEIKQLNDTFAIDQPDNKVEISEGKGGIPVIEVYNRFGNLLISLQGAHILSWIPTDKEEVIWLSEDVRFSPGQSVRGGIPICWPWFGAHQSEDGFPAHGFARTTPWHIRNITIQDDGSTTLSLSTDPIDETASMWPADTGIEYQVTLSEKLELELITSNRGERSITIGQALHTYFRVGDVSQVLLHGLDDTEYLDKPDAFRRKRQYGPVTIDKEVDRIYLDTASDCVIEDRAAGRNIIIVKCGSHSTVVWNPWQEVAENMGDLGKDGYRRMLCVESANAAEDTVNINPGEDHHLWVQYDVQESDL